jgi:outer membrane protein
MKWFLAVLLLVTLNLPAAAQAQATKIAFVDLEYALNNVDEGKKAKAILEQKYKQQKEQLATAFAELERLAGELKNTSLVLTDEVRRKKETELADAKDKYDADKKKAYEDWQKNEAKLTRDLLEGLTTIVQEIGKEGGYTFILERHDASVLYAQDNIDLTKQVIDRFNKKGGR